MDPVQQTETVQERGSPEPTTAPPDLILVLIPGLRADQGGDIHAAGAVLAPFEDQIRLNATSAYAQTTSAQVSLGSLLVGMYPSAIPLCGSTTLQPSDQKTNWCEQIPTHRATLPKVLRAYGYRTAFFSTHLTRSDLMSAHFDATHDLSVSSSDHTTPWAALGTSIQQWWESEALHPRFMVIVLSDLEVQHRADLRQAMGVSPEPTAAERPGPGIQIHRGGPGDGSTHADRLLPADLFSDPLKRTQAFENDAFLWSEYTTDPVLTEILSDSNFYQDEILQKHRADFPPLANKGGKTGPPKRQKNPWSDVDHEVIDAVYDDAAKAVGEQLYTLLDGLPTQPGRIRWTTISSTNGQSIGELTGNTAYPRSFAFTDLILERTTHVPLLFLGPGEGQTRLEDPVELIDILPSMLHLAGAQPPTDALGDNLFLGTRELGDNASAYIEFGDMFAVRRGAYFLTTRALVHHTTALNPVLTLFLQRRATSSHYWLHNVEKDPNQRFDLTHSHPSLLNSMHELMLDYRLGPAAVAEGLENSELLKETLAQPSAGYW